MTQSISFNHAADFYDATRALPAETMSRLIDALETEFQLSGADGILEVGVGTGRMARPLAAHGIRVTGVDIAPRMLLQLIAQLHPDDAPPNLLLGDATHLPFRDASFRIAMICHIFHLIPNWQAAIKELRRVLTASSVVLHHSENWPDRREHYAWHGKWDDMLTAHSFERRQRPEWADMRALFAELGGTLRTEVISERTDDTPINVILQQTRDRIHSWTWEIPEDIFFDCLPEFERWARETLPAIRSTQARYELDIWSFS